ncbi:MAG: sulfur transferase domain-containing protein [Proteobacteria bacterium]|nr:sulfur transferase domain-containing protein [Pseudomonadota bacterium]
MNNRKTPASMLRSVLAAVAASLAAVLLLSAAWTYSQDAASPPQSLKVAPQVTLAGFIDQVPAEQLRESNTLVIDLRTAEEGTADEQTRLTQAGVSYANIPMGRAPLSSTQIADFEALLAEHPDQPVLIHCASGNRAGLLWAVHMINQGTDVEDAIQHVSLIANREPVHQAIRDYALTKAQ